VRFSAVAPDARTSQSSDSTEGIWSTPRPMHSLASIQFNTKKRTQKWRRTAPPASASSSFTPTVVPSYVSSFAAVFACSAWSRLSFMRPEPILENTAISLVGSLIGLIGSSCLINTARPSRHSPVWGVRFDGSNASGAQLARWGVAFCC
jgi:hypothetical protein